MLEQIVIDAIIAQKAIDFAYDDGAVCIVIDGKPTKFNVCNEDEIQEYLEKAAKFVDTIDKRIDTYNIAPASWISPFMFDNNVFV